jgi:hypothetical protein
MVKSFHALESTPANYIQLTYLIIVNCNLLKGSKIRISMHHESANRVDR